MNISNAGHEVTSICHIKAMKKHIYMMNCALVTL